MLTHDYLTKFIRFYCNAMQCIIGNYLERNIQAFLEIQKSIQDQSRQLYGDPAKATELWSQFLSFQGPAMQNLMSAYMEQSKAMFKQMQDQLQNQSRMFSAFPFAGVPGAGKDEPKAEHYKTYAKSRSVTKGRAAATGAHASRRFRFTRLSQGARRLRAHPDAAPRGGLWRLARLRGR